MFTILARNKESNKKYHTSLLIINIIKAAINIIDPQMAQKVLYKIDNTNIHIDLNLKINIKNQTITLILEITILLHNKVTDMSNYTGLLLTITDMKPQIL